MSLDASNMRINKVGWYKENQHMEEMKDDPQRPKFTRADVFLDFKESELQLFLSILDAPMGKNFYDATTTKMMISPNFLE